MSEPASALAGRKVEGYVCVEDTGPRGQVTLKGDLASPEISSTVNELAGVSVPGNLQMTQGEGRAAIWMAPDELLLLLPYAEAAEAVRRAGEMLAGQHHMALDVSDARTVLRLSGAGIAEVLAKGAPLDLSERAFPPGTARRTQLGGLAVAIWRLDAETWEIIAFRSFAYHLMAWLEDAARPGAEVGY